jgi:NADH-quinone oxidoreductase subunit B
MGMAERRIDLGMTVSRNGTRSGAPDIGREERNGPPMDQKLKIELSQQGIVTTTLEELYNWGRKNSVWPMTFGLACCAIEMIATTMARYDLARFGAEVFRPSPRQADLMIVSGTVTKKMAPQVVRLYNQMAEPKYVIAMGACAISGGPFKQGYNVLKGIDRYIPVDVHIPGCPPRPEALIDAFMTLQKKIDQQALTGATRPRHLDPDAPSEFTVPRFGAHDLEPPNNPDVWHILNNADSCATGKDDAGED